MAGGERVSGAYIRKNSFKNGSEGQVGAGGYAALIWGHVEFESTSKWSCGNPKKADEWLSPSSERNLAEDTKTNVGINSGEPMRVNPSRPAVWQKERIIGFILNRINLYPTRE